MESSCFQAQERAAFGNDRVGTQQSWAELQAVAMVLQQEGVSECHIYTDSWSANGMAVWMGTWQQQNWQIRTKEVWGKDLWNLIWEKVKIVKTYQPQHGLM